MKILNPQLDLARFWRKLPHARKRALLLDYDGTLAPFHPQRDQAFPYPGIRELLTQIMKAAHTRLVLISGRRVQDLIPLLALDRLPEIWGSHGGERLKPDGTRHLSHVAPKQLQALDQAQALMRERGLGPRCERKHAGLALHWRGLDEQSREELHRLAVRIWAPLAGGVGLEMRRFDGGLELRIPGIHKGKAVGTLLREMGPGTILACLGDDSTDEDAFRAVRGRGLGVLVRREYHSTAADLWLKPPEELLDFLRCWHRLCAARSQNAGH